MKPRAFAVAVLLGALSCAGVPRAVADDIFQPPWRDYDKTTFQETTFATQPGQLEWETVDNDYGDPDIWMYADVWQWDAEAQGRQGVVSWPDSANRFSLDIPNHSDPDREKRVWIQVTYYVDETYGPPTLYEVYGMGAGGGSWGPDLPPLIDLEDHGDGWYTEARQMSIQPNPTAEFVGIRWSGPGMVDQLVVDTICVPEPSTWLLLAMGLLGWGSYICRRRG